MAHNLQNNSILSKPHPSGVLIKFICFFLPLFFYFSHIYSQQPTQVWVARYQRPSGSSAIANQMALDKVGNCYVLGNVPLSGGIGGILLIKYNSAGDTVYIKTYNIGAGNAAVNIGVAADSVGNVYITGYVGPTFGPYSTVLIKYNPAGVQQWIKTYPNSSPGSIGLDKYSRPYLCGSIGGSALVIKYNTDGDTLWQRTFSLPGISTGASHVKISEQGFVYLGGNARNNSTSATYFLSLKYDSNGVFQWQNIYTSSFFELMLAMTIDNFGNCYLAGEGKDGVTEGGLTIKYNSSGVQQWVKAFSYGTGGRINGIVTDVNGNAYVTGYIANGSVLKFITIKYNTGGDSDWVKIYNGSSNENDEANAIDIDNQSNVYITGRSINTGTSWDYVTIKYDQNGVQKWLEIYNNNVNAEDVPNKILLNSNSEVYVTGLSRGFIGGSLDYLTIKYNQPVGIEPIASEIPNNYFLYQNFPNPFNPVTNIKFSIPELSNVNITVFDILGRVVEVPVNEQLKPGNFEINIDGTNYTSGTYFYRMTADGNVIDTKKFVIIK